MRILILQSFLLLIILMGKGLSACQCSPYRGGDSSHNHETPLSEKKPTKIIIQALTYDPITHQLTYVLRNNDKKPLGKNENIKICWEINPKEAHILNIEHKPITSFLLPINQLEAQEEIPVTLGSLNFNKLSEVTIKSWVEVQNGTQTATSGEVTKTYQASPQKDVKIKLTSLGPMSLSNKDKSISFQVTQDGQAPIDNQLLQVKITTTTTKAVIKAQQGAPITFIDKPLLNQPINLQLESNGEKKVQVKLQIWYKGNPTGQALLYEYSSTQQVSIYFDYNEKDLPFLKSIQDKLGAKKYNQEDLSKPSSPSIVFRFLDIITRMNHYLEQSSKEASTKAGGNLVYVRLHISGSATYDDDAFDLKLTSGYNGKHVVLKGQYKVHPDISGITEMSTKELVDEAGLEAQIRNIISSIK